LPVKNKGNQQEIKGAAHTALFLLAIDKRAGSRYDHIG
jgi:hypothetical protein